MVEEALQLRVHGPPDLPTLVYLPGLHGDWTLVGSFRRALKRRVRFVEVTYPRTLSWSLDEYARAIETALAAHGIESAWLLGESFGSQIVWVLAQRQRLHFDGLLFAGGFVRHPAPWVVPVAERLVRAAPQPFLQAVTFIYARVLRFRYRHSPEVLDSLAEFIARRTDLDRHAAAHRLHLLTQNDLCATARRTTTPVYMLTGLLDPIVPWVLVRPWVRRNCPALRDFRIIWRADHNVLGTAPDAAAEQVLNWITERTSEIPTALPRAPG